MPATTQKIILSVFAATLLVWLAGYGIFTAHVKNISIQNTGIKTDAIVVLTGGSYRINTGLDLLALPQNSQLFISGVNQKVTAEKLLSLWGKETDEPLCCITLGYEANNTTQNAAETKQWVEENDIHSITLVTSDYHTPRALMELHAAMPDVTIELAPVKTGEQKQRARSEGNFWYMAFTEYNKSLFTWLRLKLTVSL